MADQTQQSTGLQGILDELPTDRLKEELGNGFSALGDKAMDVATDRIGDLTGKLTDFADGGGVLGGAAKEGMKESAQGGSVVGGAIKGAAGKVKEKVTGGGGGGGGSKRTKATKIIEAIEVGVPVHVAYNQWTQFQDFSSFMKKVESVEQEEETKVSFKAQIVWSHRSWESQILEQVPDERIVWRSKGEKGHVDGSVTFHELAPNLTRILMVLEYHPQGFFEKTGNIWRAQGRRVRAELGSFQRHVMTDVIQDFDSVEGWRGVIHEGEVEQSHDEVVDEEEQDHDDEPAEEYDEEADEPAEEADGEPAEEADEPEDEYPDEEEYLDEDEEPGEDTEEDTEEDVDEEPDEPRRRKRKR